MTKLTPYPRRVAALSLLAATLAAGSVTAAPAGIAPRDVDPADFAPMYAADYLAPFARPAAINGAGEIVGRNPVWGHAFAVTAKRGYTELPCPTGLTACHAVDINDSGWIVGWGERPINGSRGRTALLWRPLGDAYSVTRVGGSPLGPSGIATGERIEPPAEAVAINAESSILIRPAGAIVGERKIRLWTPRGSITMPAPGDVVDLSDTGWIAGNARLPFRLDSRTGEVAWTTVPVGFASARAHSINRQGELAGALLDAQGRSLMAVADEAGSWRTVGGAGPDDFAVTLSDFGDIVGHAHGLAKGSHCAVQFAGEPLQAAVGDRLQVGGPVTAPADRDRGDRAVLDVVGQQEGEDLGEGHRVAVALGLGPVGAGGLLVAAAGAVEADDLQAALLQRAAQPYQLDAVGDEMVGDRGGEPEPDAQPFHAQPPAHRYGVAGQVGDEVLQILGGVDTRVVCQVNERALVVTQAHRGASQFSPCIRR